MLLKHADIIDKLTLDEKVSLLSGKNFWETERHRQSQTSFDFLKRWSERLAKASCRQPIN